MIFGWAQVPKLEPGQRPLGRSATRSSNTGEDPWVDQKPQVGTRAMILGVAEAPDLERGRGSLGERRPQVLRESPVLGVFAIPKLGRG
jgi:hypothetical protein